MQCASFSKNSFDCQTMQHSCLAFCSVDNNNCFYANHEFRDGTPCSLNGVCYKGVCNVSSLEFVIGIYISYGKYSFLPTVIIFVMVVIIFRWRRKYRIRKLKLRNHKKSDSTGALSSILSTSRDINIVKSPSLMSGIAENIIEDRITLNPRKSYAPSLEDISEHHGIKHKRTGLQLEIPFKIDVGQSSAFLRSSDIVSEFQRTFSFMDPESQPLSSFPEERDDDDDK